MRGEEPESFRKAAFPPGSLLTAPVGTESLNAVRAPNRLYRGAAYTPLSAQQLTRGALSLLCVQTRPWALTQSDPLRRLLLPSKKAALPGSPGLFPLKQSFPNLGLTYLGTFLCLGKGLGTGALRGGAERVPQEACPGTEGAMTRNGAEGGRATGGKHGGRARLGRVRPSPRAPAVCVSRWDAWAEPGSAADAGS